jgi:phosphinothricin acetyltransferase
MKFDLTWGLELKNLIERARKVERTGNQLRNMNRSTATAAEIIIEAAAPDDFISIAKLDRMAWLKTADGEFIPDGEHVWRIWCEHALTFVARDPEGVVVAVVVAFPCVNSSYCLHKVMVAEALRGQGFGSRLFAVLFEELDRRKADCFLTVAPSNANAVKLYRNWGFVEEIFVSGYYRKTEDRLVLTRRASKD